MKIRKYSKHELLEENGTKEILSINTIYEKDVESEDPGKTIWDIMSEEMFKVYREPFNIELMNTRDTDFDLDYEPILSWGGYR